MEEDLKDAVCFGNIDLIRELLAKGVDPNALDDTALAPIHWAVRTNNYDAVQALLSAESININIMDEDGNTPLHMCCARGQEKIIQLLLQRGADPSIKNHKKKKPADLLPRNLQSKFNDWVKNFRGEPEKIKKRFSSRRQLKTETNKEVEVAPVVKDEVIAQMKQELEEKRKQLLLREHELLQRERDIEAKLQKADEIAKREAILAEKLRRLEADQQELRMRVEAHSTYTIACMMPVVPFSEVKLGPKIGEGAYADIYKGTWRGMNVAIKRMTTERTPLKEADANDFFFRELSRLAYLRHKNIIMVMGAVIEQNNKCYIMELCKRDLASVLQSPVQLTVAQRVRMALEAASALEYLEKCKLVHRDVKTSNMLLDDHNILKLTDFGYCTSLVKEYTWIYTEHKLVENANRGTPAYMAPEALKNESYSPKSDVFSFGIVMWELLTRQRPWSQLDPTTIYAEVTTGNRLPIPTNTAFPPEYIKLMEQCWLENPANRPTFSTIVKTLKAIHKKLKAGDTIQQSPSSTAVGK